MSAALVVALLGSGLTLDADWAAAAARAVRACDFNGDGYCDLAVGAPGEDVGGHQGAGRVDVLFGSAEGPTADDQTLDAGMRDIAESLAAFGSTVAAGDQNGDGYSDLVVAAPTRTPSAADGTIQIFPGSRQGFDPNRAGVLGLQNPDTQHPDEFGRALSMADFNHDGFADVAVGAPNATPTGVGLGGNGRVQVSYGNREGVKNGHYVQFDENTTGITTSTRGADDRFGDALAAGDFNSDGFADLAIGVPGLQVGDVPRDGAVRVLYGAADGLSTSGTQQWDFDSPGVQGAPSSPGIEEDSSYPDRFGAALVCGDFDGDGYTDLAIAAPDRDRLQGSVTVLYGSTAGLTNRDQYLTQSTRGIPGKSDEGDYFGAALSSGDFNGDGSADLAIGAPGDKIASEPGAGSVIVVTGGKAGLQPAQARRWSEATRGVAGPVQPGSQFGESLQSLNIAGDRADDLVIGAPNERHRTSQQAGAILILLGHHHTGLQARDSRRITEDTPGINGTRQPLDQFGHVNGASRKVRNRKTQ